jgi:hypothetical protein
MVPYSNSDHKWKKRKWNQRELNKTPKLVTLFLYMVTVSLEAGFAIFSFIKVGSEYPNVLVAQITLFFKMLNFFFSF